MENELITMADMTAHYGLRPNDLAYEIQAGYVPVPGWSRETVAAFETQLRTHWGVDDEQVDAQALAVLESAFVEAIASAEPEWIPITALAAAYGRSVGDAIEAIEAGVIPSPGWKHEAAAKAEDFLRFRVRADDGDQPAPTPSPPLGSFAGSETLGPPG